jgi:hypothetical protein
MYPEVHNVVGRRLGRTRRDIVGREFKGLIELIGWGRCLGVDGWGRRGENG